jgi:hypothetical protein
MLSETFKLMDRLAPLHKTKSPGAAAVLGFLLGGFGLGLYFRSFIDFLFPIALVIVASVMWSGFANLDPQLGLLAGSIVASMWGYLRAENSNRRLRGAPATSRPDVTAAHAT